MGVLEQNVEASIELEVRPDRVRPGLCDQRQIRRKHRCRDRSIAHRGQVGYAEIGRGRHCDVVNGSRARGMESDRGILAGREGPALSRLQRQRQRHVVVGVDRR